MLTSRLAAHPRRTLHRGPAVRGARRRARRPRRRHARERRRLRGPRRRLRGRRRADRGGHRHRARRRASCCSSTRPSPERLAAVERELANVPGVASTDAGRPATTRSSPARCGRAPTRRTSRRRRSTRSPAPTASRSAAAPSPACRSARPSRADLGRAELIAFPLLLLLSILFFRGRATLMPLAVGVTTVLGTFLVLSRRQPLLRPERVRAEPRDRARARPGDRLHAVPRHPLPRGAGRARRRRAARSRPRWRPPGRTVAFSAATVAGALITLVVFPQGFLKSMGIAGAIVAVVAALAALVDLARAVRALGRQAGPPRRGRDEAEGRWHRLAHAVMRRAGLVAAADGARDARASLPALTATWSAIDSSVIPKGKSARTVADAVNRRRGRQDAGRSRSPRRPATRAEVQAFADRVGARRRRRARRAGRATWARARGR